MKPLLWNADKNKQLWRMADIAFFATDHHPQTT